jgi:hypothetical protein
LASALNRVTGVSDLAAFERAAHEVLASAVLHVAAGRRLAEVMVAGGAGGAGVIALSARLDQLGAAAREALSRLPASAD